MLALPLGASVYPCCAAGRVLENTEVMDWVSLTWVPGLWGLLGPRTLLPDASAPAWEGRSHGPEGLSSGGLGIGLVLYFSREMGAWAWGVWVGGGRGAHSQGHDGSFPTCVTFPRSGGKWVWPWVSGNGMPMCKETCRAGVELFGRHVSESRMRAGLGVDTQWLLNPLS